MGRDMQHSIKDIRLNNPSALAGTFYIFVNEGNS